MLTVINKDPMSNELIDTNFPLEDCGAVSNTSFDTEPSSKYPITLEQARSRALRACTRAREANYVNCDI